MSSGMIFGITRVDGLKEVNGLSAVVKMFRGVNVARTAEV